MMKTTNSLFILFFVLIFLGHEYSYSQNLKFEKVALDIEDNNDYSSFDFLKESLPGHKYFFTGESHPYRESNCKIELKLFKYLYYNAGVRTILMEFGYSRGWIIEKYLETGDSVLWRMLRDYSYPEYSRFFRALKKFNNGLPEGQKIKVVAIDVEREMTIPVLLLNYLLPQDIPPAEIFVEVQSIRGLSEYLSKDFKTNLLQEEIAVEPYEEASGPYYSLESSVDTFIADFYSKKDEFRKYLGDKYTLFETIVSNLKSGRKWQKYEEEDMIQNYAFREIYMFNNLRNYIHQNPDEKCFAQFGRCHTSKTVQSEACGWYNYSSLARILNQSGDTLFKDKVLSIGIFYPKSMYFSRETNKYDGLAAIDSASYSLGITLMKVDTQNAAFKGLASMFNYLIINQEENALDESIEEEAEEPVEYTDFKVFAQFGYQLFHPNLKNLNKVFTDKLMKNISSPLKYWSFTFCAGENGGFHFSQNFNVMQGISDKSIDSLNYTMKGFDYFVNYGYDVLKSKLFDIVPTFGFGYSQLVLNIRDERTPSLINTLFGDNILSNYINPSFCLNVQLDFKVKVKFLSAGLWGGYRIDTSSPYWRSGSELIKNGPKSTLSGLYYGAALSFGFSD